MWYRYSVEHYSTIKRNKIVPYAKMWVSLEIVVQTKSVRKEKTNIKNCLYVESRKIVWLNLFTKQK